MLKWGDGRMSLRGLGVEWSQLGAGAVETESMI